jgi:acetyl-CoA acetyltransferase
LSKSKTTPELMASPENTPIIVGVGDIRNKSPKIEDALDPSELMTRAIRCAVDDTGLQPELQDTLRSRIDSISVVPPWSWTYADLPGLLADRLGSKPSHKHLGDHGGNQPGLLCDEAARRIASGDCAVAVIAGGESLASGMMSNKSPNLPVTEI